MLLQIPYLDGDTHVVINCKIILTEVTARTAATCHNFTSARKMLKSCDG